jgi:glutamine synthetase
VFCAAVIRAVHKYGGLLRAVVASSRNDHRLGANEAPPAIISIFLGEQLADVFDQIAKGGATASKEKGTLTSASTPCRTCPGRPGRPQPHQPVRLHRQPLRVPCAGLVESISGPMVAINTIIAESLDFIATELEAATDAGTDLNVAIQKVLEAIISEHGSVVFNGDGYSDDWQVEAEARGLLNLRTTVDALPQLDTPEAKELFSKYGVLSERELASRYEVYLEQYALSVTVEARQTLEIAQTVILPAALRYQQELAVGDQHRNPSLQGHRLPQRQVRPVSDADLRGKWSVVFFYPADFTFVCPTELGDLADNYAELPEAGRRGLLGVDRHPLHPQGLARRLRHDRQDPVPDDRRPDRRSPATST